MTDQPPPPPGNYPPPPPPPGGYPPPPPGGGYPPPPPGGGYPPPPPGGGYPPPPPPPGGAPRYAPPPQGGYPPPQGGYPPSPGGYPPAGGPGYGGAQPFSVGDAFSWAWNKFSNNAVPLIVATLAYGLIILALQVIINLVSAAVSPADYTSYSDGSSFSFSYSMTGASSIIVAIIGWVVSLIVGAAVQSAYLGGILDIANGQQVSVGSFFRPRNIGSVIIAGLIVGIITTIGFFLCIIPGLIATIMLMFTVVALIDRNLPPVEAVKTSFDISKANFGNVFLAWLVMVATFVVGALLCGVGLLVAAPVGTLILVYTYRKLIGGHVAELNPQPLPPSPQPQAGPPPQQY